MPGKLNQLQQPQLGKESTFGTAVAQTVEMAGVQEFTITPMAEVLPNRALGSLAPSYKGGAIAAVHGEASMVQHFNYQHAGLVFDSVLGTATPSSASPYTREYYGAHTSVPPRSFYTFGKGDSSDMYSMVGAICAGFTLTVENKNWVTLNSNWVASQVATDSLDSVNPISPTFGTAANVTVSRGTYGGSETAIDCDVLNLELVYNTNTSIIHGLGSITGCDYDIGEIECTLSVTIEANNAVAQSIYESYLGSTPALSKNEWFINITDGTANNILEAIFSGYLSEVPVIYDDADGRATVTLNFIADKDSSTNLESYLDISLTNTIADYWA
jgi:hypothetical protein